MSIHTDIDAVLNGDSDGCIVCGDCLEVMAQMPDGCVQCCVTSPPYWGLRDYGVDGQLGLEPTPDEYIAKMVAVFAEVRRVLRDDGTLWLNMGDSYASGDRKTYRSGSSSNKGHQVQDDQARPATPPGLKPKDLCGIPWRLALALQADGWWLRSDTIWAKGRDGDIEDIGPGNPMPGSETDRPMSAHEYIFLLTKSQTYYYDDDAVRVDWNGSSHRLRDVWFINNTGFSGAHFACFPEEIPRVCILAGTSAKGACPKCGAPWERLVETERVATRPGNNSKVYVDPESSPYKQHSGSIVGNRDPKRHCSVTTTTGWEPTCQCCPTGATATDDPAWVPFEPVPCLVLDPFGGSGTVGAVAARLKRNYVLIELNPEYADMAKTVRLAEAETGVPVAEAKAGQMALFDKGPAPRERE